MATGRANLYDCTRQELESLLAGCGVRPAHARVWRYVYREGVMHVAEMFDLPPRARGRLADVAEIGYLKTAFVTDADDGLTQKYLLELTDGERIETVLMRYPGRATACLSSQVGFAMGCVFCATGQMGFTRHLTPGEIVAQAALVDRQARLRNIVLMGMGEPLHNYDATLKAVDILRDPGGLAIAAKRITLSTVGVVPGIIRLADERREVSLAVSLHAATQVERDACVPVARAWPLDELLAACRYYARQLGRHIFFEWTLIAGRNDSPAQACELARLLHDVPAHVNLIPLNPTADYAGLPSDLAAARAFQAELTFAGIPSTIRQRRGIAIAAGCGQLATHTT